MYTLIVENDQKSINLSETDKYTVYKIDGLNPPAVSITTSSNSTSDGGKINSQRVGIRNIVIYLTIDNDVEANRNELYSYFLLKKTIKLKYKNGVHDVYIEGTVESIEVGLFDMRQVAQISIICPSPYFKAVDELLVYFSDITPVFEFPFSITAAGTEIAVITHNIRKTIINSGQIETGVLITLRAIGDVVKPTIYSVASQGSIALNLSLIAGDEIIINTNVGQKGITLTRNGVTTNVLGYVNPDLEWFTLQAGDNVFTYDCESGNANLQITFSFTPQFGGV